MADRPTDALLPCPFCKAEMAVREHSAFHPSTYDCWLGCIELGGNGLELIESDYAAWNRRSDYQRGLEDAAKIAEEFGSQNRPTVSGVYIAEAIREKAKQP